MRRSLLLLLLTSPVLLPALAPLVSLLREPEAWAVWSEHGRLLSLGVRTTTLLLGVLLAVLPTGVVLAFLFHRTDLPGRRLFQTATLLAVFLPLPLYTAGWQAILGVGGIAPAPWWGLTSGAWSPWGQGMGAAIWIHALAALPWVVLLVGLGLGRVERSLEEDALLRHGWWKVVLGVSLPRARAALAGAALWVVFLTVSEITVTDMMQVRTFAEEIYTQSVIPEPGRGSLPARMTAVTLPQMLLVGCAVAVLGLRWRRRLGAGLTSGADPLLYPLGPGRRVLALLLSLTALAFLAAPLASLVWRAGWDEMGGAWRAATLGSQLALVARGEARLLAGSLLLLLLTGVLAASLALTVCVVVLRSGRHQVLLIGMLAMVWAMPGPLLGLGLKQVINQLLLLMPSPLLERVLWHGPSIVPLVWVDLVRFFPCAVAILWPTLRQMPSELHDLVRLEQGGWVASWRMGLWPWVRQTWAWAALAAGLLSVGEVSASKLVSTPGQPAFAEATFTQMHFGVTGMLAARGLVLVGMVLAGGMAALLLSRPRARPRT